MDDGWVRKRWAHSQGAGEGPRQSGGLRPIKREPHGIFTDKSLLPQSYTETRKFGNSATHILQMKRPKQTGMTEDGA